MLNSGNQFVLYIRVPAGAHEMFQACYVHTVLVINTYVQVQARAEKKNQTGWRPSAWIRIGCMQGNIPRLHAKKEEEINKSKRMHAVGVYYYGENKRACNYQRSDLQEHANERRVFFW
jgi:hypothetical protein